MKTALNRIFLALLTASIIISAFACSSATNNNGDGDNSKSETTEPVETVDELADNLPQKDFEGADYVIYGDLSTYCPFYDSEQTGEVVDDAVFNRNLTVSDRFNVNFVFEFGNRDGKWRDRTTLANSILAGDSAFDLAAGVTLYQALFVSRGCFLDLNNINYLDFTRPWWAKHINNQIEINGKLYMASGYYDMPSVSRATVVYFSSELADSHSLGNMYDLVYNNTWTLDKMIELGKSTASDVDGNGIYDENDCYGITSEWDAIGWQIITTGYTYTTKDENAGTIELTGYNDTIINISEKLYDLLYNSDYYYSGYTYQKDHNYENMWNVFTSNNSLFLVNDISQTQEQQFRDMGTYGILPMPKFMEGQENYGTTVSAFVTNIPCDVSDAEYSAIILEALNAESYKTVLPAYYEIALSNKYLNDDDSVKMLDIVYANTYCDFSYIYAEAGWDTMLPFSVGIIKDYASWFDSKKDSYNSKISDFIAEVNALEG